MPTSDERNAPSSRPKQRETRLTARAIQLISWNRHDVTADVRGINHLWNNLLEVPRPNQPHVHRELVMENVQCMVNTFIPVRRESVEERSFKTDILLQLSRHFDKDLDTRLSEVRLTSTMIRKHYPGQLLIVGFQGVLVREKMSQNFNR